MMPYWVASSSSMSPGGLRHFKLRLQLLPDPTTLTVMQLKKVAYDDTTPMEDMEYGTGGYMPIQIKQWFGPNKDYRIIRKLGWGTYATVWLSKDNNRSGGYCAIKVIKASRNCTTSARQEIRLQEYIRKKAADNTYGRNRVLLMNSYFTEGTLRNRHLCLVTEVMGPSLLDLLCNRRSDCCGYDEQSTKRIIKQVIEGLRFLHQECRIIHGDLKLANILISMKDSYASRMEEYVEQFERFDINMPRSFVTALEWQERMHLSPPITEEFLAVVNPFKEDSYIHPSSNYGLGSLFMNRNTTIKITDLGCGIFESDVHPTLIQTRSIRALEVTLEAAYSFPIDMWSVGCITFELLTGTYLFKPAGQNMCSTHSQVKWIWEILNGIPRHIALSGLRSLEFFNLDGTLRPTSEPVRRARIHDELIALNHLLTSERALQWENFILYLLRADPAARATASAALMNTWLAE